MLAQILQPFVISTLNYIPGVDRLIIILKIINVYTTDVELLSQNLLSVLERKVYVTVVVHSQNVKHQNFGLFLNNFSDFWGRHLAALMLPVDSLELKELAFVIDVHYLAVEDEFVDVLPFEHRELLDAAFLKVEL